MAYNVVGNFGLVAVVKCRPPAQDWRMEVASQLSVLELVDAGPWPSFVWHLRPRNLPTVT